MVASVANGVFLISASIFFLLSSNFQQVCQDLSPPSYILFTKTVDNFSLWGNRSLLGYFAETEFNISGAIRIAHMLRLLIVITGQILMLLFFLNTHRHCAANDSLYTAAQITYNFSELSDLEIFHEVCSNRECDS